MKRVATFGDVHGCLDELQTLYKMLEWESLDEIRHSGDLVDRGPDSSGVVQFCREHNIQGVLGNHDGVINEWMKSYPRLPKNPDKARTINQLMASDTKNIEYLKNLPHIHIDDEMKIVYVHGGILPSVPFHQQPELMVCRLAMIHPSFPDKVRWNTIDRNGRTEEQNRADGWRRWYEVYNHEYDCIYGHNVYQAGPFVHQNSGFGRTIGIDTGCNWSGELTAVIMPELRFVSTPKKKEFTTWHDLRIKVQSED